MTLRRWALLGLCCYVITTAGEQVAPVPQGTVPSPHPVPAPVQAPVPPASPVPLPVPRHSPPFPLHPVPPVPAPAAPVPVPIHHTTPHSPHSPPNPAPLPIPTPAPKPVPAAPLNPWVPHSCKNKEIVMYNAAQMKNQRLAANGQVLAIPRKMGYSGIRVSIPPFATLWGSSRHMVTYYGSCADRTHKKKNNDYQHFIRVIGWSTQSFNLPHPKEEDGVFDQYWYIDIEGFSTVNVEAFTEPLGNHCGCANTDWCICNYNATGYTEPTCFTSDKHKPDAGAAPHCPEPPLTEMTKQTSITDLYGKEKVYLYKLMNDKGIDGTAKLTVSISTEDEDKKKPELISRIRLAFGNNGPSEPENLQESLSVPIVMGTPNYVCQFAPTPAEGAKKAKDFWLVYIVVEECYIKELCLGGVEVKVEQTEYKMTPIQLNPNSYPSKDKFTNEMEIYFCPGNTDQLFLDIGAVPSSDKAPNQIMRAEVSGMGQLIPYPIPLFPSTSYFQKTIEFVKKTPISVGPAPKAEPIPPPTSKPDHNTKHSFTFHPGRPHKVKITMVKRHKELRMDAWGLDTSPVEATNDEDVAPLPALRLRVGGRRNNGVGHPKVSGKMNKDKTGYHISATMPLLGDKEYEHAEFFLIDPKHAMAATSGSLASLPWDGASSGLPNAKGVRGIIEHKHKNNATGNFTISIKADTVIKPPKQHGLSSVVVAMIYNISSKYDDGEVKGYWYTAAPTAVYFNERVEEKTPTGGGPFLAAVAGGSFGVFLILSLATFLFMRTDSSEDYAPVM